MTLYPDNSNRGISGEFGFKDGIYQRLQSNILNSYAYYKFHNYSIMFIDPDKITRDNVKMIEIKANLKEYKLPYNTGFDNENRIITMGFGRYVDDCRIAYINAELWQIILGDSINYLNENCVEGATSFSSTRSTDLIKTKFDISTSYKFQLEQWQEEMIKACGFKVCINEPNQPKQPR